MAQGGHGREAGADLENGGDGGGGERALEATTATPLLLNPTYSRSKSIVSDELRNIRISLKWCGLDHSSFSGKVVSYVAFAVLGLALPLATYLAVQDPESTAITSANKLVQLPETALAAISFFTLSGFFQRQGLRQLLLLDGLRDDSVYVRRRYNHELDRASKYLAFILLPSLSVEVVHKVLFFSTVSASAPYLPGELPWNTLCFLSTVASWVYRTGVFLLVCVLFRLTCELQILRFEGFRKLLEGCESDAGDIFREHNRIRRQLLVTSHRYRIFIIGCFVTITVSQLGALLLVLSSRFESNFVNSGDLLVCSVVQLSGLLMCLLGAAKITHRAQRTVAVAARWHVLMTYPSNSELTAAPAKSVPPTAGQYDAAAAEVRKALVVYLEHNSRGITVFGFALDRGLLHTLFAFEMSLVLWILSKVVVLS
ncbi:unnamed protein product [Spirodela intermedia]|uniref:Uncharacterized protein n=1 Tax=Spirodela intermedia TaxID=51605 RepID=A0A7I8JQN9_SPIIN|nr:unnamed protein product [Spirodela intermedia]CAA6672105.1 unnamed protein product [Spirodela intermedia]